MIPEHLSPGVGSGHNSGKDGADREHGQQLFLMVKISAAHVALGEYTTAQKVCEENLRLARTAADQQNQIESLLSLGFVAMNQGKYGEATKLDQQALTMVRDSGDRHREAWALNNLGIVAGKQGKYTKAKQL